MVALYWLLNFLLTYWFIKDVLPTLVWWCIGELSVSASMGVYYVLPFTRCRLEWWPTKSPVSPWQVAIQVDGGVYLEKNFFTWSHCKNGRLCMCRYGRKGLCERKRNSGWIGGLSCKALDQLRQHFLIACSVAINHLFPCIWYISTISSDVVKGAFVNTMGSTLCGKIPAQPLTVKDEMYVCMIMRCHLPRFP